MCICYILTRVAKPFLIFYKGKTDVQCTAKVDNYNYTHIYNQQIVCKNVNTTQKNLGKEYKPDISLLQANGVSRYTTPPQVF